MKHMHLHFDCVSGIAGDMTLGALIDLGVPSQVIVKAIACLGLGSNRLHVESVKKSGIAATNVWVDCKDHSEEHHGHTHDHYHYGEIRERIESSKLGADVIALSLKIFDRVAEAEAKIHGSTVSEVAFHEVGAIDSIVDIVGSAAALCWLKPSSVSAGPVAMGRGTIHCAHGTLPVPSPAALEILKVVQAPICDGGIDKELCTPTGAAILAAIVDQWGSMPAMTPVEIGYGAGDIDLPDRPNVLRMIVGKVVDHHKMATENTKEVVEIQANIDDMSPELCDYLGQRLFDEGALDVWWTPIVMKKGRPALSLGVMSSDAHLDALVAIIFKESSSIGVRIQKKERRVLDREVVLVSTAHGNIPLKVARYHGEVVNAAPEFEACQVIAREKKLPLKEVFRVAQLAWERKKSDML